MKKGVVYKSGEHWNGVRVGRVIKILKLAAATSLRLGKILVGLGVAGAVMVYAPWLSFEARYRMNTAIGRSEEVIVAEADVSEQEKREPEWQPPDQKFSVYIPKIQAVSRVIAEVDSSRAVDYGSALEKGVAQAKGLANPGEKGTTFLFAHSAATRLDFARFNAVFYLLDKLTTGDRVEILYEGKLFSYEVEKTEILPADDVRYLVPQRLEEKLVLQTCHPPGTTWKRLFVVARPVS